jgi:MFS family permease
MLLFMVGGTMADRFPKKHLIQIGQLAGGLMALIVAVTLTTGYVSAENTGSWWVLMVNAVVQGLCNAVAIPARQAIIPELVEQKTVMNAMALNSLEINVSRLLAPAMAGFIIDWAGFAAVFYIMAGLYFMAVFFTAFIPVTHKPKVHDRSTLAEASQGLSYIWHNRVIFVILTYTLCYIVFFLPYQQMLPVFTDTILKVDATGLGILQSASGIGALIVSVILASIPNRKCGALIIVGGLIAGIGLVIFSVSRSWYISLAAMFVIGVAQSIHGTALITTLQSLADPAYLGRVMGILMLNQGLSGLGTFLVGLLSEGIGVQWAIGGFAGVLAALSALYLLLAPR